MAQTTSAQQADAVINVIGQDAPGGSGAAQSNERQGKLDSAATDAVSARRRREFDAARARLRDRAFRDNRDTSRQAGAHAPAAWAGEADRGLAPLDQPPEHVRKRYLRAGNPYFLNEAPYPLAFEDPGPNPVTRHNRPDVVEEQSRHRNAQRPDSGQALHLAVLTGAMREQGFSERSIARVQQRAARMLAAFGQEGVSVPMPKVFDPKAPSGREHHRRQAFGHEPVREIDRTPAEPSPMSVSR